MRPISLLLLLVALSVVVLTADAGASRSAASAAAFASRGSPRAAAKQFAFDGSDVASDEDFEFDLDVSSKRKLEKLHEHHLDGGDDEEVVEAVASADGDARVRTQRDLSTKVAPSGSNYGRGMRYVASQDVLEGEVLFTIPFVDVMNADSARQGRVKALLDANADLPSSIVLAVHLLEEKFRGESSRFHDYLETLSSSAAINSTLFYTPGEMALLQGSHLSRLTAGRVQGVTNFFDALVGPLTSLAIDPPLFTKDQFTKENFAWAMATVWMRALSATSEEKDAMIAPILDTIGVCVDADCPPTHIEWDRQAQRVVVYATQNYMAGEEVLLNLGSGKSSTLLMLNHGFARSEPYTAAETLDISIFLDPNDTLISIKSHLLETHNMSLNGSYVLRYNSEELDPNMVKSLKLKLLTAPELDKYPVLLSGEPGVSPPIVSLRNEYVFTRAIVFTCKNLLDQYPTTLAQDRAAVSELEARYRDQRLGVADKKLQILRALVIEKDILLQTMKLAQAQWQELVTVADPAFLAQ